jgi:nicotinate-nucleotide adenylyltransferase
LFLAEQVIQELHYDRVVFVPAAVRPLKDMAPGASGKDRLEMLRRSVKGNGAFRVDECEVLRPGPSYTHDTILYLEEKYAGKLSGKMGLVIGDDLAGEFPRWFHRNDILAHAEIILARRLATPDTFPYAHVSLDNAVLPLSSSDIRARIAGGRSWRYLVAPGVAAFIEKQQLYRPVPAAVTMPVSAPSPAEALLPHLRAALSCKRFDHSVRVAETAKGLCGKYGLDVEAGYVAGLAHDVCKELPESELLRLAQGDGLGIGPLELEKPALLHGRAAAIYLRDTLGVTDEAILEAVREHTFGRPGMGILAQVIYIADKIEPGRPQVTEEYRRMLDKLDLHSLLRYVLAENFDYVVTKGKNVAPQSYALLEALEGNNE